MVLLGSARGYKGYLPSTIVQLSTQEEAALIAQGLATTSAGPVTPGAVTTSNTMGRLGIAAAGTSVVLTNPLINAESRVIAYLSNAAADATATSITRIACATGAAGSAGGTATFTVNAAATAAVSIDWQVLGNSSPV